MTIAKLSAAQITQSLSTLVEWVVVNDKLHKSYRFTDFVEAFGFMTKVAIVAEKISHHPELFNVYNRVTIDLTTHDAGGISARDFELAQLIDRLGANHNR